MSFLSRYKWQIQKQFFLQTPNLLGTVPKVLDVMAAKSAF
ncbi:hypothetical protein UNSW2_1296 [Campylobacter concisus UNSW2]|uniref:Uncharacterized protein n=1 Tax=Campylobacter concisus UNSW2 TaxID=1242965 RepID=U2FPC6_9BACT|nr:hypothetical protein UNSW2_1296 [Campylobacter concisus UNSW2]